MVQAKGVPAREKLLPCMADRTLLRPDLTTSGGLLYCSHRQQPMGSCKAKEEELAARHSQETHLICCLALQTHAKKKTRQQTRQHCRWSHNQAVGMGILVAPP